MDTISLQKRIHSTLRILSKVVQKCQIIQNYLYPPTCLLCGDPGDTGHDLCTLCAATLPYLRVSCPRCARPLFETVLCEDCRRHPPAFDRAFALFHYEEHGETGYLIKALKFGARYPCARLLGSLLAERVCQQRERPEAIVPVPLHPRRYRQRGFNQAIEIGRVVSSQLHIPLMPRLCRRVRYTDAQAQLSAVERHKNVSDAFEAKGTSLPYRHLAVLDDVVTTGATVNEVAIALRRIGVEKVEVWACARTGGFPFSDML